MSASKYRQKNRKVEFREQKGNKDVLLQDRQEWIENLSCYFPFSEVIHYDKQSDHKQASHEENQSRMRGNSVR